MSDLPTGTVTFLFTDIEGSTRLAQAHPERWETMRSRHDSILRTAMESNHGFVFDVVGDMFCSAFHKPGDALHAALQAQHALNNEPWGESLVRVRMGIHTGDAETDGKDYRGYLTLSLVERLTSAGHGGQILLSGATETLLQGQLPQDVTLRDLGEHKLKDAPLPVRIFQVVSPGLPGEFPPLRALDVFPNNLPTQLTSFVGREKEMADIKRLLENTRLLTLVGPGGTGKSRLSIQVAMDILRNYPDGVWLVELAPVANPALVAGTTAAALKLPAENLRPAIDMLCDYLRERHLLLILDNCEHLVEACAQMADTLLHACIHLQILVSSREALGVPGEVSYRVPSLKLPDVHHLPSLESLTQYEAVKLFIDRALTVLPDFHVTNDSAPAVAQICHRLDGIPLAIELAAAKVSVLSVDQISERLDHCFRLLTGGSRTALPRHQTLRATIDWSYNLLTPPAQKLLRRLSVFVNGWSLEAAETVCSDDASVDGIPKEDVLDLITQLASKSLITSEVSKDGSRYRMLETVRQYASDRLVESGESESLRDRHLVYFLNLAETAEPHLRKTEQIEWLDRLEVEHDNLRSALEWSLGKSSAELSLRLAGALGPFWDTRLYWKEGSNWLYLALSKQKDEVNQPEKKARAKALYRDAELADELDNLDRMKESSEAAFQLCSEIEDKWGMAYSRWLLAFWMGRSGRDSETTLPLAEQSMQEMIEIGDVWAQSRILATYKWFFLSKGSPKDFDELSQRQLALARESGDRKLIADRLVFNADYLSSLTEEEWKQAEEMLSEAKFLSLEVGYRFASSISRQISAKLALARGEYNTAKALIQEIQEYYHLSGEKNFYASSLLIMALILEAEGDVQQAIVFVQKSMEIHQQIGDTVVDVHRAILGFFNYRQGNLDLARKYLKESLNHFRIIPITDPSEIYISILMSCNLFLKTNPQVVVQLLSLEEMESKKQGFPREPLIEKPSYERNLSAARALLNEDEFNTAWEAGSHLTLDEGIDLALKTLDEL